MIKLTSCQPHRVTSVRQTDRQMERGEKGGGGGGIERDRECNNLTHS